ncbi:MAG: Omp28-related outer membrane protein [Bacteroidales bacterium]|nr:Omp28-related outer membrane protein [Bacteroidales bacterium]
MNKMLLPLLCLLFSAASMPAQNPRNVLIYNLTSTDCGPCSCMDSIFHHALLPLYPNTVIVALHGIGSGFNQYQGDSARNYFRAMYEPSGFIDGLGRDCPYLKITDSTGMRYANSPEAPVQIAIDSKSWNEQTRQVDLSVTFTNLGAELPGAYWFNVIVTEDHIKHVHRTMIGCSTPDVPNLPFRNEYFNDWVTRKMVFWSQGDSLIGPSWPGQQAVTRSCSFSLDTAWIPKNCYVVVNVYNKADSLYKSPIQQVIRQSVTGGVGIPEEKPVEDGIIRIFPNPASDLINVHFSLASERFCSLSIYDMTGKEIENILQGNVSPGLYNIEINTQGFPGGTYLVVLSTTEGKSWEKIVIL